MLADKTHYFEFFHTHSLLIPYLRLNLIQLIFLMNYDFKHLNFTIVIMKVIKQ